MPFGMGVPKTFAVPRREARTPMEVGVHIAGHAALPGHEATFTENVSSRGARVLSSRRWQTGDQLVLLMPSGNFQAMARVAYCESAADSGFVLGLEFVEPSGTWVVEPHG